MKKFISALVLALSISSAAYACPTYQIFSAYIQQPSGTYVFYKNYLNPNTLISDIQNNPSISGRVHSQDSCTDAYTFWQFANGTWWQVR